MPSNTPPLLLTPGASRLPEERLDALRSLFDLRRSDGDRPASVDDARFVLASAEEVRATLEGLPLPPPQDLVDAGDFLRRARELDRAAREALRVDVEAVAETNAVQRLERLERAVVRLVDEHLRFEAFEVRHLNPRTNRLDLVIVHGLDPLAIGEHIHAEETGNGISGYVAVTGKPYLCPDVSKDPRYIRGLEAASSALTVALRHEGRTLGVFTAEAVARGAFSEVDLRLVEVLARHLAPVMHTLDLLVAERIATRTRIVEALQEEFTEPLERLRSISDLLGRLHQADEGTRRQIQEAVSTIRQRLEACRTGVPSVLGTRFDAGEEPGATRELAGSRILIADDDPSVRDAIRSVLARAGCDVVACANGGETIDALQHVADGSRDFDLVISDVGMPDRNGYEVFRAAKATRPDLPVILMTGFGYDPHHSIVRSSQEGLQCFLFKPFHAEQLLVEVRRTLAAARARNDGPDGSGAGVEGNPSPDA